MRICARIGGALLVAIAALFGPVVTAAAENRAVIVGVSQYPNLPESMWLRGPQYDAVLVRDFLLGHATSPFRAENVIVLADGVDGAGTPDLAGIRAALARTADDAGRGDFVYLHFSGHGSRAPAREADTELDGLDELFLPADIGKWDDTVGAVPNALVDDEIGRLIDAIRAKGAFVFAVFDSCHSGTVTRGAPVGDEIRYRKVPSEALGIPDVDTIAADLPRTRGRPGGALSDSAAPPTAGVDAGGMVAFYAAQSTEATPEMRLPAGKQGRQPHGLFTFTLFEVLGEHPGLTYRRVAQEVLRRYAARYIPQPTPLFEGDLDAVALGATPGEVVAQWPVDVSGDELAIPAGRLQGVSEGARLALLASPAADLDERIGMANVTSAENLTSRIATVADGASGPLAMQSVPVGAYARLVEQQLDFGLTVAVPELAADLSSDTRAAVADLLEAVEPEEGGGLRLTWAAPGEAADLRLAYLSEAEAAELGVPEALLSHLWLLPPTGDLVAEGTGKSFSIDLDGKDTAEAAAVLRDSLARIARATNVIRLGEAYGAGAASSLELALLVRYQGKGALQNLDPAAVPLLQPGDEVHIAATNSSDRPLDLNVLYVGRDYSISRMYSGRVHPAGELKRGLLRIVEGVYGRESIVIVASPAAPQSATLDLGYLEQDELPTTRAGVRRGLPALLAAAGFGTTTRSAAVFVDEEEDTDRGAVIQFQIETQPR